MAQPYTVAKALAALKAHNEAPPRPLSVIEAVGRASGYTALDLRGPSREPGITLARHIACYLLHMDCSLTSTRTGELMGGRHYSTVLYAMSRIEANLAGSEDLRRLVEAARALVHDIQPQPPCG